MTNEVMVKQELLKAIASINVCIPLLEGMNGKIPSDILDLLDDINKLSVLF